ncbi:MAG TPA: chemotaxis protein CheW [Gallionellaceae bacterium]
MNLPVNGGFQQADLRLHSAAAVLKIDGLDLLIQQRDIRTLESVSDVDRSAPGKGSVGWISFAQQRWPVFCVSSRLDLQLEIPPARGTCVLLALEDGYAGVLCDDVTILRQVSGRLHELPVAMRRHDTPIRGVVSHNQGMACVSDAGRLADYIAQIAYES